VCVDYWENVKMLKNIIQKRNVKINFNHLNNLSRNSVKVILNNKTEKKLFINNELSNQIRNYSININKNRNYSIRFPIKNENSTYLKLSNSINNFIFKATVEKYFNKNYHTEGKTKKKYNDIQEELRPKLESVPFHLLTSEAKEVINAYIYIFYIEVFKIYTLLFNHFPNSFIYFFIPI